MTDFIVHSIPGSPFGRAVLATLEEKGARYRLNPVAPGTFRAEPHITRHPFGKVPVLEHDGFLLYETQAILRYLDRVLPDPPLTPADPRAAGRMDQVMNINDWYLFTGCGAIITFQRVVGPRLMGMTPDLAAIEAAMPKAHAVFAELSRLLDDQTYLAGETVTLADMLVTPQLDFFHETPEWGPLTAERGNLIAYTDRMLARPSLVATTWDRVVEMAKAA